MLEPLFWAETQRSEEKSTSALSGVGKPCLCGRQREKAANLQMGPGGFCLGTQRGVHEPTLFPPARNLRKRVAASGQRCGNGRLSGK